MGVTVLILIAALAVLVGIYYFLRVYQPAKPAERYSPYAQGLNYIIAGDLDKAREKLIEAVRKDSENLDAYLKLGSIMREKGQVVSAIKVHQSLTVRTDLKPAERCEILKELALDYEKARALRRAAEFADKILAISPDHLWALQFRIKLAEALQDWSNAYELARRENAVSGKKNPVMLALYKVEEGRQLMDQGKGKEGRVKCREAIKLDRTNAHAYLTLAQSYINEDREEDAVKELKNFLEANPEQGYLAYDLLENLYFNLGRFGELELLYRQINEKRPDDLHAAQALARFLRKKGEIEGALDVCRSALEKHPEDLWLRRFMIRTLLEMNRIHEIAPLVLEVLDRVLIEHPRYVCSSCGFQTDEPLWRCPRCAAMGAFNL
jgi:lipopolysaccharide biosynthesis regulator YciM